MSGCTTKIITKRGEKGLKGDNAFKFIKEFNTDLDGGIITATLAEMIACGALPVGCLNGGILSSVADLNIQIWLRTNEPPSPAAFWNKAPDTSISYIRIDDSTGTISVAFTGAPLVVIARIVVIG